VSTLTSVSRRRLYSEVWDIVSDLYVLSLDSQWDSTVGNSSQHEAQRKAAAQRTAAALEGQDVLPSARAHS
jgi:hypothetical protein